MIGIFPIIDDYNKLNYDKEGLYSITATKEADIISELILNNFNDNSNIIDGTGGLGGNTFSFSKFFNNVTTIELNRERYNMLNNNIKQYNLKNIKTINDNCINYLTKYKDNFLIYFFDLPWGGPSYRYKKSISIGLVLELLKLLLNKEKLIIFKLPFNYNLNEFSTYNYKLYKVSNYFIIMF